VVPPTELSSSTVGAHLVSHVIIPPELLADTHAALLTALSGATQLASVPPKPVPRLPDSSTTTASADPPVSAPEPETLTELIVSLFCPFDNASGIIDTIVSGVVLSQRADVGRVQRRFCASFVACQLM
jgi:hypothetical protein